MNNDSSHSNQGEEARIRATYARRDKDAENLWLYSWLNPANLFTIQERDRQMVLLLNRLGITDVSAKTILEIGCGKGYWLREFIKWGAQPENITGVDLLADHVEEARRLCSNGVRIECGSAATVAVPAISFDIVLQSTVFTSILDSNLRRQIASEMLRVVKEDGFILWYDYHMNNPWNSDVRGVKKNEIHQLFPDCHIELQRITLAPPAVRLLAPYFWMSCCFLERLKIFNTHYLGVIRKR